MLDLTQTYNATLHFLVDAAAMADDFYQRDVQAEYDEMDYDANEQFDDDDVDVGEADIQMENNGYGAADDDDEDDDDESEEVEEEVTGAEGLASVAGFKALLAKARGDGPAPGATEDAAANGDAVADKSGTGKRQAPDLKGRNAKKQKQNDHISKILAATGRKTKTNKHEEEDQSADQANPAVDEAAAPVVPAPMDPSVEVATVGPDGLRILTLEAVRKEIWLNHGKMGSKRLMKIFDVKKKSSAERRENFRKIVKELCTVEQDHVKGNMLVLKQHWSHMG